MLESYQNQPVKFTFGHNFEVFDKRNRRVHQANHDDVENDDLVRKFGFHVIEIFLKVNS